MTRHGYLLIGGNVNTDKITIQGVTRQYLTELLNIFNDKGFVIKLDYNDNTTNLNVNFLHNVLTITFGSYGECKILFKPQLLNELPCIPREALRHYLESLV